MSIEHNLTKIIEALKDTKSFNEWYAKQDKHDCLHTDYFYAHGIHVPAIKVTTDAKLKSITGAKTKALIDEAASGDKTRLCALVGYTFADILVDRNEISLDAYSRGYHRKLLIEQAYKGLSYIGVKDSQYKPLESCVVHPDQVKRSIENRKQDVQTICYYVNRINESLLGSGRASIAVGGADCSVRNVQYRELVDIYREAGYDVSTYRRYGDIYVDVKLKD